MNPSILSALRKRKKLLNTFALVMAWTQVSAQSYALYSNIAEDTRGSAHHPVAAFDAANRHAGRLPIAPAYPQAADIQTVQEATPSPAGAVPISRTAEEVRVVATVFPADISEGVVGRDADHPVDQVYDNVFNITVAEGAPTSGYVLEYELYGGAKGAVATKTVNDLPASRPVEARRGAWTPYSERLPEGTVRAGLNTVVFTIPGGAGYTYRVRNVRMVRSTSNTVPYLVAETLSGTARKSVAAGAEGRVALNSAVLDIAPGILREASELSVSALRDIDMPALAPEMVNVTAQDEGYRMLPHGELFKAPARLSIGYDKSKIPAGYTEQDVKTFFFDNIQKKWVALERDSVDTKNGTLVSKTTHFTDFVNGVLKVPESPETGSYAPNSIKDIKAADPAEGIVGITQPKAGSRGSVSTSFPLKMPAGRSGMQPSLSVGYSSEGGNGWMGQGWDLEIPFVGIDTRWGVPVYDGAYETEIYSIGGEQLAFKDGDRYVLPNRKEGFQKARTPERRFFPRVEGSYSKVIRHGSSPSDYWWEVISKDGTRSFFGGDGAAVVENCVLRQPGTNNIGHWALYKTMDSNGNYTLYTYDKGIFGGNPGSGAQEIYPKRIDYAMHAAGTPSRYTVKFISEAGRRDVQISARTGFLRATSRLLKGVEVALNDSETIRSYVFKYTEGDFSKSLLSEVSEKDAAGKLFYTNRIEYNKAPEKLFADPKPWTVSTQVSHGDLKSHGIFQQGYSFLGGNKGKSVGGSFALGIGAYTLASPPTTDTSLFSFRKGTFGAHGSYSNATSETLITFMDVDGDNLPDRVYKSDDGLSYSKNLSVPGGPESFAPSVKMAGNIAGLGRSKTTSWGVGVNGNFANVTLGFDYQNSTSTTSDYFMDFNSDGLVDFVSNGKVYFNRVVNGIPTFFDDSAGTPYPIYVSAATADSGQSLFDEEDRKEKATMLVQNPLHDIVRVWVAPRSGQVRVKNSFRLLQKACPEGEDCTAADGVSLAFQYGGQQPLVQTINAGDFAQNSMPDQDIAIAKGEKLYFRVSSRYDGTLDNVEWDPSIQYLVPAVPPVDSDNRELSSYTASADFVNSLSTEFTAEEAGTVDVLLDKPIQLSDDATVTLRINGTEYSAIVSGATISNGAAIAGLSYPVNKEDKVSVTVHTDSQIDWAKFHIAPVYTNGTTGAKQDLETAYSMYNDRGSASLYTFQPGDVSTQVALRADNLPYFNNYSGRITLTAKKPNRLLAKTVYNVNGNIATVASQLPYTVSASDLADGPVYLEATLESDHPEFYTLFDAAPITLTLTNNKKNYIDSPDALSYQLPNPVQTSHKSGEIFIGQPTTLYFVLGSFAPDTSAILSLSQTDGGTVQPVNLPNPTLSGQQGMPTSTYMVLNPGVYHYDFNFTKGFSPDAYTKIFITDPGSEAVLYTSNSVLPHKPVRKPQNLDTALPPDGYDARLGHLYRGWGGFALNGNNAAHTTVTEAPDTNANYANAGTTAEMKVDESKLKMSQAYTTDPGTNPSYNVPTVNADGSVDLPGNNASLAQNYFLMLGSSVRNADRGRWKDVDEAVYISRANISSSRAGIHSIDAVFANYATAQNVGSTQLSAPGIKLKNQSISAAGGVSFGVAGLNASKTLFSEAKSIRNVLDYNGDGFPDDFSKTNIKLTYPVGFLSDRQQNVGSQSISKADTKGLSSGFSFSHGNSGRMAFISTSGKDGKFKAFNEGLLKSNIDAHKGSTRVSVSANAELTDDFSKQTFLDINGDGLPDKFNSGQFGINAGNTIAGSDDWGVPFTSEGQSFATGAGLGVSFFYGSFDIGANFSSDTSNTKKELVDINGDGLPDRVEYGGNYAAVSFNVGNRIDPSLTRNLQFSADSGMHTDKSINYGANAAGTVIIPIPFLPAGQNGLKLNITAGVSLGQTTTKTQSGFRDVNGDGYPDFVTSDDANNLTVQLNQVGTSNLLRKVTLPTGGSWEVEYTRTGNTYDLPQSRYIMTGVTVKDGLSKDAAFKPDTTKTRISYKNPYYSRWEREFYGFQDVNVYQLDTDGSVYRKIEQSYLNRNYYLKGLLVYEAMKDAGYTLWTEKKSVYQLRYIHDANTPNPSLVQMKELEKNHTDYACFPALTRTESKFYEGQQSAGKSTYTDILSYDAFGNATQVQDAGDTHIGQADVMVSTVSYKNVDSGSAYYSLPVAVKSTAQNVVRERKAVYNEAGNPPTLDLIELQVLGAAAPSVYNFEYDVYGNITKSTGPANYKGERFFHKYTYDGQLATYPVAVEDAFGYTSRTRYDYRFGAPLLTEDMNLQPMRYKYDSFGRTAEITGPYEMFNNIPWTIRFSYFPVTDAPLDATTAESYAKTEHYDPANPGNYITTVAISDGLGTPVQVKKSATIFNTATKKDEEKFIVSGKVVQDAFGRALKTYYPTVEASINNSYTPEVDGVSPTVNTYDVMDRVTSTTLPGEQLSSTVDYGFAADRLGRNMFYTKFTDELGTVKETFADIKGRTTTVKEPSNTGDIINSFTHDALGAILEVKDVNNNLTQSAYDNLGRRISYKHPDSGTSTYVYDPAGNMTSKTNAASETVAYEYDYTRLKGVNYPKFPENNVRYYYGKAKDASAMDNNAVGRLWYQTDATGTQYLKYGRLGELTYQRRSVAVPGRQVYWFGTEWEYDTWNRVRSITYPDGEKVTYAYNKGGNLKSMASKKDAFTQSIINNLGYDKFEQRVFLEYGNGTKTTYEYENDRRRLLKLNAQTAPGRSFQQNLYQYDAVSNVLQVHNNAPFAPAGLLGGGTNYAYAYDDLYRLTSASGNWRGRTPGGQEERQRYTVSMAYDNMHNVTRKEQKHERSTDNTGTTWLNMEPTSYRLNYSYKDANHPHAPSTIIDEPNVPGTLCCSDTNPEVKFQNYAYDAKGNPTGIDQQTCNATEPRTKYTWDEENRLRFVDTNPSTPQVDGAAIYTYDAGGERIIKDVVYSGILWKSAEIVGPPQGDFSHKFSIYPNGLVSVNILGTESGPSYYYDKPSYTKHYYAGTQRVMSKLGKAADIGKFNCAWLIIPFGGAAPPVSEKAEAEQRLKAAGEAATRVLQEMRVNGVTYGQNGGYASDCVAAYAGPQEKDAYWYHTDHLGSSSFVTGLDGEVNQNIEYFPSGEVFVENHINSYNTPYKFNGKELDDETGYYYYGARYYNPRVSLWLNVDPLAEKFAGRSPYEYTFSNPINFTDPDGRSPNPIRLLQDLFKSFIGTTSQYFHITAQNNGIRKTDPNYYTILGRIFENTVIGSLGENKNTKKYRPSMRSTRTVIPDIVGESVKNYTDFRKENHRYVFPEATFQDAKFTGSGMVSDQRDQIKGFIDVLSNMRGGYQDGVWNPTIKASDFGAANLVFITTKDTTIDPSIVTYAAYKNVRIFQRFIQQDEDNPSSIRVAPFAIPWNLSTDKVNGGRTVISLPPFNKAPGQSENVNWNQK